MFKFRLPLLLATFEWNLLSYMTVSKHSCVIDLNVYIPSLIAALMISLKWFCRARSPYRKDPMKLVLQITVDPV